MRLSVESENLPNASTDADFEPLHNRQWDIRAQIAATPAETPEDRAYKAMTLQLEATRDSEFECDALGSARDLALSIAADAIRAAQEGDAA